MANQVLSGYVFNNAGAAVPGATVELFPRNTTTTADQSTTTNSSGYWTVTTSTEGRFDVRITNGSSIRFLKYDDEIQITTMEVANFNIRNPADTFDYAIIPAAIVADRTLNLPLTTGTDTLVSEGVSRTFTADMTFNDNVNITWGTGGDVDLDYNGTDLVLNLTVVGSGDFVVNGGSIEMDDSEGITFGTGKDATIQHNGTNLVILPRAVGAGDVLFQTSNAGETLIVSSGNTDNSAAAGHAVFEAKVGGTTSTGDPQVRLTIPSGTSWYTGVDNTATGDPLQIGTGTTVGSNRILQLDGTTSGVNVSNLFTILGDVALSAGNNAGAQFRALRVAGNTITYTGTTTVTVSSGFADIGQLTMSQSGGAVTVNDSSGLLVSPPTSNTSVTLTDGAAVRIRDVGTVNGTLTNQHGVYIEDMTGGSSDFGLTIEGADTAAIWVSSAADNTNAANGIAFGSSRDTNLYRGAANVLRTDDIFMIGDSVNANMTLGITINQGANDNELFAGKSSDIAHGLTSYTETDSFTYWQKMNATLGGLQINAFSEDAATSVVLQLRAYGGTANTAKTTASRGLIEFLANEHNGSNALANITADGNVFVVRALVGGSDVTRIMTDEDGDFYSVTSTQTFDAYDDLALVESYGMIQKGMIEEGWQGFVRQHEQKLIDLKILGGPVVGMPHSNQGMTNVTQLQRLHNGALLQLYTAHQEATERIIQLETKIAGLLEARN